MLRRTRGLLIFTAFMAGGVWAQSTAPAPPAPRGHSTTIRSFARRGYLGVGVVEMTDERARSLNLKDSSGVEVKRVDENSPAAKAGIRENDIILEVDGHRIETIDQFIRTVGEANPGTKLALTIWRNGAKQTLNATLESRPAQMFAFAGPDGMQVPVVPPFPPMSNGPWDGNDFSFMTGASPRVGFEGEMLTPQLAEYFGVKEGVLVRTVVAKTPAEKAGLKAGDVVTKVNGTPVTTPREISSLVHMARNGKIALTIVRNKREQVLNVEMPEPKGPSGPDRLQL
jgi:serine protease Do